MALPDDFSPWEHLHEQLLNSYNFLVERTFIGVPSDDISTPLGGMKVACILQNDDTVDMTLLRLFLFFFVYQGQLPTPVYGIPVQDFQAYASFKPQVHLFFLEDWSETLLVNQLKRTTSQISFRLVHETTASLTPVKAKAIALKIQEFFSLEGGFYYEKGTVIFRYRDLDNGYDLRLFVQSEAEGVRVVERLLEVQGHAFDEKHVTLSQSRQTFPTLPTGEQLVYGKERKKFRKRPTTRVRFTHAELHIQGLPTPVILVDRAGKRDSLTVV